MAPRFCAAEEEPMPERGGMPSERWLPLVGTESMKSPPLQCSCLTLIASGGGDVWWEPPPRLSATA